MSSIIFNSVKHTNSGHIIVWLEKIINQDEFLKISVEDTGIGMDLEQLKILKESFNNLLTSETTSNSAGIGLGLRIASTLLKYIAPKGNN